MFHQQNIPCKLVGSDACSGSADGDPERHTVCGDRVKRGGLKFRSPAFVLPFRWDMPYIQVQTMVQVIDINSTSKC